MTVIGIFETYRRLRFAFTIVSPVLLFFIFLFHDKYFERMIEYTILITVHVFETDLFLFYSARNNLRIE